MFKYKYSMPKGILTPTNHYEVAFNVGLFLYENAHASWAEYATKIKASDQRKLFGFFMGKGTIILDGTREIVEHQIKVDFGNDVHSNIRVYLKDNEVYTDSSQNVSIDDYIKGIVPE